MAHPSMALPRAALLGFKSRNLEAAIRDVSLGLVAGVDLVLWNYSMASLIFAGALAGHLQLGATVVLVGAALVMILTALRSSYETHVMVVDEQAVAVLATIATALTARGSLSAGASAATMLAIMATVTLAVGACLYLSARFNAAALLQLVPFQVVCGFLGGLGWLLLGAGVSMLTGHQLSLAALPALVTPPALLHLLPALAGGALIFVALRRSHHFAVLPGLLVGCFATFWIVALLSGASVAELRGTWLFDAGDAGMGRGLRDLDFSAIDLGFIASVAPEMATIVMLGVLGASINLSGLEVAARKTLPMRNELRSLGSANLASGLVMGLPAVTEIVASTTYRKVGARGRLFMVVIALCCGGAAIGGAQLIAYLPKVVMGALVFFAAIQFLADWLISASRKLNRAEAAVVWSIFATTVAFGFMTGIALGVALACLLFVVRYSRIDVVSSTFTLAERGSTVDRPVEHVRLLAEAGPRVRAFNLRGFLFFGTANGLFEQLKTLCENGSYTHFIFNFQRVTAIDSTVAQTLARIDVHLESLGITPVYCCLSAPVAEVLERTRSEDEPRVRADTTLDAALKWTEESILARKAGVAAARPLHAILTDALGDADKAARLAAVMQRMPLRAGDHLFDQGDEDTSLYVIERGAIEVRVSGTNGQPVRVMREFREGTVIGEMASYSDCRQRSASAVVVQDAVVHRFGPDMLATLGTEAAGCQAILHEFVARVVVARLQFMNKRLAFES